MFHAIKHDGPPPIIAIDAVYIAICDKIAAANCRSFDGQTRHFGTRECRLNSMFHLSCLELISLEVISTHHRFECFLFCCSLIEKILTSVRTGTLLCAGFVIEDTN
jgi:hypothetical protein